MIKITKSTSIWKSVKSSEINQKMSSCIYKNVLWGIGIKEDKIVDKVELEFDDSNRL